MKWFIVKVTCATLVIETSTHWGRSAGFSCGFRRFRPLGTSCEHLGEDSGVGFPARPVVKPAAS
jgi:hypothetical protein